MDAPDKLAAPAQPEEYGVEVLCANWNPVLAAAEPAGGLRREQPEDLPAVDVDAFLKQFYRSQIS